MSSIRRGAGSAEAAVDPTTTSMSEVDEPGEAPAGNGASDASDAPDAGWLGTNAQRARHELATAWTRFAPAVGFYALIKVIGFASFFGFVKYAHDHGYVSRSSLQPVPRFFTVLGSWDGGWYTAVAKFGYHPALIPAGTGVRQNSAAFFPLYPALIRIVHTCTGLGYPASALLGSILASLVAAAGIYAVARLLVGQKAALICVALWAVFPSSGVEWSGYSEATLVAVASWCLYFTLQRRWLLGGFFALLSGLGRPTAFGVVAAFCVGALTELAVRRGGRVRPLVGLLMAPAGVVGFLLWVGLRMGRLDGYSVLERKGWGQYIDFGAWTARGYLRTALGQTFWHESPQEDLIAVFLLTALPIILIVLFQMRPPVPVVVYVLLFIAAAVCSHQNFGNISRYLLPAFPLLLPFAAALRRLSWPVLLAGFVILALASGWYAGYVPFVLGVP